MPLISHTCNPCYSSSQTDGAFAYLREWHCHLGCQGDTCREVPLSMTGISSAGTRPAGSGKSTGAVSNCAGSA